MASLPNFNELLLQGFQTGRELKRQEGERTALTGLVNGDQNAMGQLATYNPQMALQVQNQQAQQKMMMAKQQREMLEQGKKAVGQAALQIAQLPEAQRAAAWDNSIDYLVGQGWDGLAQFKGKYSPQSLMGVISEAGLANELRQATQPSYQVIPEGGTLVNTRDPGAVQQFSTPEQPKSATPEPVSAQEAVTMLKSSDPQTFLKWQARFKIPVRVSSPQEAAALPPGTIIMSIDGRTKVKQ